MCDHKIRLLYLWLNYVEENDMHRVLLGSGIKLNILYAPIKLLYMLLDKKIFLSFKA